MKELIKAATIIVFIIITVVAIVTGQAPQAIRDSCFKYRELYNWYGLYEQNNLMAEKMGYKIIFYDKIADSLDRDSVKKRLELKYHVKLK